MKRNPALPIAALIGVASVVPLSVAAFSSPVSTSNGPAPGITQERYGMIRYDTAASRWRILSSPVYASHELTGVSCSASTGVLTVAFTPLNTIGTFTVDEDDAYAGRYEAGAEPTTRSLAITFRKSATGTVVSCNATELRIGGSSLQILVRGTRYTPTVEPTTPEPSPTRPSPPVPQPPTSPTPSSTVPTWPSPPEPVPTETVEPGDTPTPPPPSPPTAIG